MTEKDMGVMEKIISLAKRRGFVFQGSEIYGGLAGTWDYGPLGVALSNNLKRAWWKQFVEDREDTYGVDASILMSSKVWVASGHVAGFADPLVEDLKTKERYRADHLLAEQGIDISGLPLETVSELIKEKGIKSPKGNELSDVRQFNMMFETRIGATSGDEGKVYLRPETAQGIFVNFKNVVDTMRPKMPFGIAQIGKAFRNEIAPRDFLFRVRELEQMEVEYFIRPEAWKEQFDIWLEEIRKWNDSIGLSRDDIREYEVPKGDLAHYSERTVDFEFNFPGKGFAELSGFAYRTDHDLRKHTAESGENLSYTEADGSKFIPHVLEPSFGVGRAFTAVLCSAYREDEMGGEVRVYLKLPHHLAPYRVMVSPLLKNKPELVEKAREVFLMLKKEFGNVAWDDNGNVGKRYRRQDEIGTPFCVTIDFETLEGDLKDTVTVRDRDTGEQKRVAITELTKSL